MKTVTIWEKLKLQIDNLEIMHNQHESGIDMGSAVYWQVETINELLSSIEQWYGADKVREMYKDL